MPPVPHKATLLEPPRTARRRPRPESISVTTKELRLVDRVLDAYEVRDLRAGQHVQRMAAVAGLLGERLGMTQAEAWMLRTAASLHDIGKLTVSARILHKPGPLNRTERTAIERHALVGHQILSRPATPIFRLAATIALTHHERWDGDGYPLGLRGEDIPLVGRIAAVADVFDALLSERPYRGPLSAEEAIDILRDGRGAAFDPDVVDALFEDLGGAFAARSATEAW